MSAVLDAVREKYPAYKDVPDDKLAKAIGEKYPSYLKQPDFMAEYHAATNAPDSTAAAAGKPAPTPGVKISPYEQIQLAGGGKDPGMEPGTEFTQQLFDRIPRQIGTALDTAGKAVYGMDVDAYGGDWQFPNARAAITGRPLPADLDMQSMPAWAQAYAKGVQGLVESSPKLAAAYVNPHLGAMAFGLTPQGFDPKQAAMAEFLPFAGQFSGAVAEAMAVKAGVTSDTALAALNKMGGAAGATALIAGDQARQIAQLPPDQRHQAWIDAAGNAGSSFLLGLMGERKQFRGVRPESSEATRFANAKPITADPVAEAASAAGAPATAEALAETKPAPATPDDTRILTRAPGEPGDAYEARREVFRTTGKVIPPGTLVRPGHESPQDFATRVEHFSRTGEVLTPKAFEPDQPKGPQNETQVQPNAVSRADEAGPAPEANQPGPVPGQGDQGRAVETPAPAEAGQAAADVAPVGPQLSPDYITRLRSLQQSLRTRMDEIMEHNKAGKKGTPQEGQVDFRAYKQTLDLLTDVNGQIAEHFGGRDPEAGEPWNPQAAGDEAEPAPLPAPPQPGEKTAHFHNVYDAAESKIGVATWYPDRNLWQAQDAGGAHLGFFKDDQQARWAIKQANEPDARAAAQFKPGDKVAFKGSMGIVRGTVGQNEDGIPFVLNEQTGDKYPLHDQWKPDTEVPPPSRAVATPMPLAALHELVEYPDALPPDALAGGHDLINRLRAQIASRDIDPDTAQANREPETSLIQQITGSLTRLARKSQWVKQGATKGSKKADPHAVQLALGDLIKRFREARAHLGNTEQLIGEKERAAAEVQSEAPAEPIVHTYPGDKKASASITALKVNGGWANGVEVQHRTGNMSGKGWAAAEGRDPRSVFPTKEAALSHSALDVISHGQGVLSDHTSSPVQKTHAAKMIDWAAGYLLPEVRATAEARGKAAIQQTARDKWEAQKQAAQADPVTTAVAAPAEPEPGSGGSADDALRSMLERAAKRINSENEGQKILDDAEDAGRTVPQIVKEFVDDTFPHLPQPIQQRVMRYIYRDVGLYNPDTPTPELLAEYYQPGRKLANGDTVVEFHPPSVGHTWSVTVKDQYGTRNHMTYPEVRHLTQVLGPERMKEFRRMQWGKAMLTTGEQMTDAINGTLETDDIGELRGTSRGLVSVMEGANNYIKQHPTATYTSDMERRELPAPAAPAPAPAPAPLAIFAKDAPPIGHYEAGQIVGNARIVRNTPNKITAESAAKQSGGQLKYYKDGKYPKGYIVAQPATTAQIADAAPLTAEEQRVVEAVAKTPEQPTAPVESKTLSAAPDKLEAMLHTDAPDITDARLRVQAFQRKISTMRELVSQWENDLKRVEQKVLSSRRDRYSRTYKVKGSATKADKDEYYGLQKKIRDGQMDINIWTQAAQPDQDIVDRAVDAGITNNPQEPLLRRLDRKVRMTEPKPDPALVAARDAELKRVILEKYPDATPEEIKVLTPEVSRAFYHGGDPWNGFGTPDLYQHRRRALSEAVEKAKVNALWQDIPEEVQQKVLEYGDDGTRPSFNKPPKKPRLTTQKLEELKKDIATAGEKITAVRKEKTAKRAEEEAAEEAKQLKLLREAQMVADEGKRIGQKGGPTPAQVRDRLTARIKDAIDGVLAKDTVTLKQGADGLWVAQGEREGTVAFGDITPTDGGRFRVSVNRAGDDKNSLTVTVPTQADAEWVVKAMAAEAAGKSVIGVPGDGVYRLMNSGKTLLNVWRDAQRIQTGSGPRYTSSGGAEAPPKKVSTEQDWLDAKEYHGLKPADTFYDWSPALNTLAKKLNPEHPGTVTVADMDRFVESKKPAKPGKPAAPTEAGPGTGEGPGSPSKKQGPDTGGGFQDQSGADIYGIAARVRAQRAQAGRVVPIPSGEGVSPAEAVAWGRELLRNGASPEAALRAFEKTGAISYDAVAVTRAHGEALAKAENNIEGKFGTDSNEFRMAKRAMDDWDTRTKPMQTEWHKIGQAQQGETDIDTGSFTGLRRAWKEASGEDFTPEQEGGAKDKAQKVKQAEEDVEEATDNLYKQIEEDAPDVTVPEPGSLDEAREQFGGWIKGGKMTPQQVKTLWKAARKFYLDKGITNYNDVANGLATDLGVPVRDVREALGGKPEGKRLTNEMWNKQKQLRHLQDQARIWLKTLASPRYKRIIKSIPRRLFNIRVGLHGTVALGTHAPMVAFQPPFWKTYAENFGRMYKMVWTPAYHEMQMQDLLRRPNYVEANRAGLINDPFQYEEMTNPVVGHWMGRLAGAGTRGYAVLKLLRQDMFDQHWDALPQSARQPEVAHAIAVSINHATGVVAGKAPRGASTVFFAPRLEASRIAWLAVDPARALDTAFNWKKATPGQKTFAANQLKEKAWVAGTAMSLLALGAGVLAATHSKQKINFTDPFRGDWLKFKIAGMDFTYGNPMLTLLRLPFRVAGILSSPGGKLRNLVYPDENFYTVAGEYVRSQLSPFAGLVTDQAMRSDWLGRQLPDSLRPQPKRLLREGIGPYTWPEYVSEQALPIPFQEAVREVWKTGMGMNDQQVKQLLKAWTTIMINMGTGGRLTEDNEMRAAPTTDTGTNAPAAATSR